ncbi:hypothetical protein EII14_02825 [Alloprevotella sp. OH1205_COT-284]|nr:hypothetical protein EII14_02825 [Alloprevotella sp. OH1205_COT-284]
MQPTTNLRRKSSHTLAANKAKQTFLSHSSLPNMKTTLSLLLLLLALSHTAAGAQTEYKYAYIRCEDKHGAFLRNDTIREEKSRCYFITPPTIPFYTVTNFLPSGTNICGENDLPITMTYTTEAYCGLDSLLKENVEHIDDGMSFVIMQNDEGIDRLWQMAPDGKKRQTGQLSRGGHDAYATWQLVQRSKGWAIYNEATNRYVDRLDEKDGQTHTAPVTFTLEKIPPVPSTERQRWKITDPRNGRQQIVTLFKHNARPYFGLTLQYIDAEGKKLRPDSLVLVRAGKEFRIDAPRIEGYELNNATPTFENAETITEHGLVEYVYRSATSISLPSTETELKATYDLFGRKALRPRSGLHIVGGRKVLLP